MKLAPLFKRSSSNKISFWQIEIENNRFRTESGFSGGKKILSEWTECKGKSYNTANEQALKQAQSLHKKKIESGAYENIKDIDNSEIFEPMLAKDYEDYKDKITFPVYSNPKLDGVRCIIKKDGMKSRTGKPIVSAPHIFEDIKYLFDANPDLILDGELYSDKLVHDFDEIISCVKKTKPTKEDLLESKEKIQYHIYDLPSSTKIYSERVKELNSIVFPECCILVPVVLLKDKEEIKDQFVKYIELGYEGQILRTNDVYSNSRTKNLLKHKDFKDEEFIILGVKEGIGKLMNKLGKIVIKTKFGIEVDVAVNGTHAYLTDLWNNRTTLIGKEATVKYFNYTEDGSLRFPKCVQIDRSWEK